MHYKAKPAFPTEACGPKPGRRWFSSLIETLRVVILPPIEEAYGFLPGIDTLVERDEEDRQ
jgi:hypothetical protein